MGQCAKIGCTSEGLWEPVVILGDGAQVRIRLPIRVCDEHRRPLAFRAIVPALRDVLDEHLRKLGVRSVGWMRSSVEFERVSQIGGG